MCREASKIRSAPARYLYQNGVYTLYTIYSTSDVIDRNRHYERLHRAARSGHDRPLFTNADQDKGGRVQTRLILQVSAAARSAVERKMSARLP
jgi:hypothetical protein